MLGCLSTLLRDRLRDRELIPSKLGFKQHLFATSWTLLLIKNCSAPPTAIVQDWHLGQFARIRGHRLWRGAAWALPGVVGSSGWREEAATAVLAQPRACCWLQPRNFHSASTQTSSGSSSPAGRGAEDRGRDWRDSILWWQRWAAAAGRDPEQPRLLPASVGGTSPPGQHPAAHSAQASEDTQATDFKSDNSRQEEGRLVAREPKTWSASQLQQAFGGCQCQQQ